MTNDNVIWMSALSLLVAFGSLCVAISAKRQGKKTGLLGEQTIAIQHLRGALFDVTNNGYVTRETLDSIQAAKRLSALVFSPKVRTELDRAYEAAAALDVPDVRERLAKAHSPDNVKLGKDLQVLITRMNEEAALGGADPWRWLRSTG